ARGFTEAYFLQLALLHEDMHNEAITYTRQTLSYSAPPLTVEHNNAAPQQYVEEVTGDARIPGGAFLLGSKPEDGFVFDNEQWAHAVTVASFAIARTATTNAEFAAFVNDGG